MYSRNSFGSFYPVESTIHKLNPIVKLVCFLLSILIMCLTNSLYINLFLLGLIFILMLLSFVPFRYYLKTFWSLRYIYILLFVILYVFGMDIENTLAYIVKLICIVEYLNVLAYTTSPSENTYAIEKILSMFNIFYLPVNKIAFKIDSILRYIPLMLIVEYKTLKAQSSRGLDYNHSNIVGRFHSILNVYKNIIYLTKLKSKETAYCSELRLFSVKAKRINYSTNKVGFYDIFFIIFHLALFYSAIIDKGLL